MNLIDKLKERNHSYVKLSKEIISEYEDFLDNIFLELSKGSFGQGMNVDWASIDFHSFNPLLINIVGIARYTIGSTIQLPGSTDTVYVDEHNVNNFRQPLRIVLPLQEMSNFKLHESVLFVEEYTRLLDNMDLDALEELMTDMEFLKKHFTVFGKESKGGPMKTREYRNPHHMKSGTHGDFDLSDLDLDAIQLASLKMLVGEGKA